MQPPQWRGRAAPAIGECLKSARSPPLRHHHLERAGPRPPGCRPARDLRSRSRLSSRRGRAVARVVQARGSRAPGCAPGIAVIRTSRPDRPHYPFPGGPGTPPATPWWPARSGGSFIRRRATHDRLSFVEGRPAGWSVALVPRPPAVLIPPGLRQFHDGQPPAATGCSASAARYRAPDQGTVGTSRRPRPQPSTVSEVFTAPQRSRLYDIDTTCRLAQSVVARPVVRHVVSDSWPRLTASAVSCRRHVQRYTARGTAFDALSHRKAARDDPQQCSSRLMGISISPSHHIRRLIEELARGRGIGRRHGQHMTRNTNTGQAFRRFPDSRIRTGTGSRGQCGAGPANGVQGRQRGACICSGGTGAVPKHADATTIRCWISPGSPDHGSSSGRSRK